MSLEFLEDKRAPGLVFYFLSRTCPNFFVYLQNIVQSRVKLKTAVESLDRVRTLKHKFLLRHNSNELAQHVALGGLQSETNIILKNASLASRLRIALYEYNEHKQII